MTNYRIDSEEEALFRSYPYAIYDVQSPSTISSANSAEIRNNINESPHQSPIRSETFVNNSTNTIQEVTCLARSRYSSSHGSTNSFLQDKKIPYDDVQIHGTEIILQEINHQSGNAGRARNVDCEDDEEEDEEYFEGNGGWWSLLAFSNSNSCAGKFLGVTWRFMLSVIAVLIVFYIVTKPPAPKMTIKMAGIPLFQLGEGVDAYGVSTKMLTCNCSVDLVIDNKSKLFGLHIHPPMMAMSFGNFHFAKSQGPELEAGANGLTKFQLYVGIRKKPLYGAGRSMQDMLDSKTGLPLAIQLRLRSSFHVVWGLIKPKFDHKAECLILLGNKYDKKRRSQIYISRCRIVS